MYEWQHKLERLQGPTQEQKDAAEVVFMDHNPQAVMHFLRGTDDEAARRVQELGKSAGCWIGSPDAVEGGVVV
jgi:hypothetical protein